MLFRPSLRKLTRTASVFVAGVLLISACGASETSTGDRDRNVGGGLLFASAIDGVARNRIGDASLVAPTDFVDRRQEDGRTIVGLATLTMDKNGSRNELGFVRVGPGAGFDQTFGTNAVRRIVIEGDALVQPILDTKGRFVVPHVSFEETGNQQIVGLSRYDLSTGELDPTFGNAGKLDITPVYVQDLSSLSIDNEGGVLVIGTESNTRVKWDAWRWTAQGLDSSFGEGGRLDLDPSVVDDLGKDESFNCVRPTLASRPDGRILALYRCLRFRTIVTDEGGQSSEFIPIMGVREFTTNGKSAGKPRFVSLDTPSEAGDEGIIFLNIVDVDFGTGANASSTYVTIQSTKGYEVLEFNGNMGQFNRPPGLGAALGTILPRYAESGLGVRNLGLSRLVVGETTIFVGIAADLAQEKTVLEIGAFPLGENQMDFEKWFPSDTSFPIADYPSILHSYDRIDYVGDDVFMNLAAAGYDLTGEIEIQQGLVAARSGYLMIDRSGATRPPFGSADGIALYPARDREVAGDVVDSPGIYASRDGSLYTLSYQQLPFEDGQSPWRVRYIIDHYTAKGKKLETMTFEADGFQPFFSRESLHDFDGVDNFYVSGFTPSGLGVAKLSLKGGGYDTDFGVDGIANFPSQDVWGRYFAARVRVQPDGSVDAFAFQWSFAKSDDGSPFFPLHVWSVRLTPAGQPDPSKPEMTVTLPDLEHCSCPQDSLSLEAVRNAALDAAGRLVVAVPDLRTVDENGNRLSVVSDRQNRHGVTFQQVNGTGGSLRELGGAFVRRYNRDGLLDQTFGDEGQSSVSLYEVGPDVAPAVPSLAISPEGNILLATTGLEVDIPEDADSELDFAVKGEYSYAVLINDSGTLINFTPRTPDPAVKRVAEIIIDSRTEMGTTAPPAPAVALPAPTGNAPAAEQTPVAAAATTPPGLGADVVVPTQVVQVNPTKRPIITALGTPADRAIDVRWSVPESLAGSSASYTVTASPGGQKCTTSTNSCVFKKLEPWTTYTFTIKTVTASSSDADVTPLASAKPVRVLARDTRTDPTKLITPASTGKRTWRATGGCKVTSDGKLFTTPKDAALCTLSLTTAKVGKVPKTTRTITVVVRAVAK